MRSRRPPTELQVGEAAPRAPAPDVIGGQGGRQGPFTGGHHPAGGSCSRQNRGTSAPWRNPKPPRRETCIPSAASWGKAGQGRNKLGWAPGR